MKAPIKPLIIDTHVFIWMMASSHLLHRADKERLQESIQQRCLYVCAISFWEIAMLAEAGRLSLGIPLDQWVHEALSISGLNVLELSIPILLESVRLPNDCHKDPADRMIIASARVHHYHLLTYDQKIIQYAQKGYLNIVSS